MKFSSYIVPTLKEDPSDAVVQSHRLMMRAGLIRKESAGMYMYLPLGFRVLRKITEIIRHEMDSAGAHEFLMPELTNSELWKESGRWAVMGPEMIRIKDRNGSEYALGPTHEEAFTNAMRGILSSYRDMPVTAYQINTKFRDEIRPRFGVIRSKEFIMKDAYSFDMDADGLEASYQKMRTAYRKIFDRCGLDTIPVKADTGAMGGSESEEFMVASEVGEEVLLLCGSCGYRANREKAGFQRLAAPAGTSPIPLEAVETPGVKSIDDLVKFFGADADSFMKSLVYLCDGKPVMAVVPGSREINEHKLKNFLKAAELELAPDNIVEEVTGAPVGFAGPVGAKARVIFDISVKDTVNGITGANKIDLHYRGVNPGRDFQIKEEADISSAREGDMCPECGAPMYEKKGIEVGHIFKLGYKYTKSMGLTVLDEKGQEVTPIMGCYGIGVNRTMAAVVEQNSDAKGIMWPKEVAPFQVHLVGIAKTDEEFAAIEEIYSGMKSAGIDCIYDDRKASPGIKFADADLIGIPVRVTAGKGFFASGEVEVKLRSETSFVPVKSGELIGFLKEKGLV